jgi:hypothetical protein
MNRQQAELRVTLGSFRSHWTQAMSAMLKLFRQLAVALAIALGGVLLVTSAIGQEPASDASTPATVRSQDTLAIHEILNRCEASLAGLKTYDVNFTQTMAFPMKTVIVDLESPSRPGITKASKWVPLAAGEVPIVHTNRFRQVWSRGGQQRIDLARSHGPPSTATLVNNGDTLRSLSTTAGETTGSVRNAGSAGLTAAENYGTYLRGEVADLARVLRNLGEHSGMRLLPAGRESAEYLTAIVLPVSETQEYHVWFDARHGQLPSKVESWREEPTDAGPVLLTRMEVVRFHETTAGASVPQEMIHTTFCNDAGEWLGRPTRVARTVVDVEKSQWNAPLDEALFVLKFAAGTEVADAIDELQLVVGEGDDGHSVDLLVQNAKQKRKLAPPTIGRRFDVAKVRPQDAAIAKLLLNYDANLSLDESGAVTHVAFDPLQAAKERGGYAPVVDNALVSKIAQLENLQYLGLNHTQVTDEGLKQLAGLKQLKQLSLQGTRVSDEGMKYLEPLASLERLWLDNTLMSDGKPVKFVSLTDSGLVHLARLPNLTHLYLANTDVTDAGLAHLKSLGRLEQVSVKGTGVTAEGIAAAKAAMPGLQRME